MGGGDDIFCDCILSADHLKIRPANTQNGEAYQRCESGERGDDTAHQSEFKLPTAPVNTHDLVQVEPDVIRSSLRAQNGGSQRQPSVQLAHSRQKKTGSNQPFSAQHSVKSHNLPRKIWLHLHPHLGIEDHKSHPILFSSKNALTFTEQPHQDRD